MLIHKAAWALKFATELHKARPTVETETALRIATDSHVEYSHLAPEEAVELFVIDRPPNADGPLGRLGGP